VSKAAPGPTPTLDAVLAVAQRTMPGARMTLVALPSKPTDLFTVYARHPEDPAAYGRSRIRMDRYSLQVLATRDTRKGNWGSYIVDVTEAIHFGDIFGTPTRVIAFVASLFAAGQVLTGFLIWWKKV
jgi:uncharacterized iron-regulated membrane protein